MLLKYKNYDILIDDEDYKKISVYNWYVKICSGKPYVCSTWTEKSIYLHRFLLDVTDKKINIDHINGNGLDNRKCNLRVASTSQNGFNRKLNKNSTTKYKGVVWHIRKKKYQASIKFEGISYYIGNYIDVIDAAKAYDKKALELFGEYAKLNFPEEVKNVT